MHCSQHRYYPLKTRNGQRSRAGGAAGGQRDTMETASAELRVRESWESWRELRRDSAPTFRKAGASPAEILLLHSGKLKEPHRDSAPTFGKAGGSPAGILLRAHLAGRCRHSAPVLPALPIRHSPDFNSKAHSRLLCSPLTSSLTDVLLVPLAAV